MNNQHQIANGPPDKAFVESEINKKRKSGSNKPSQKNFNSRNPGILANVNTAQAYTSGMLSGMNINQLTTQNIQKGQVANFAKAVAPKSQNMSKLIQKNTHLKDGSASPDQRIGQYQVMSHQQLPQTMQNSKLMMGLTGGASGHVSFQDQHIQSQQVLANQSSLLKNATAKNLVDTSKQKSNGFSNYQKIQVSNILATQKFVGKKGNGIIANSNKPRQNLIAMNQTQNLNKSKKMMEQALSQQNQTQGIQRVNSQQPRPLNDPNSQLQDPNCYTDDERMQQRKNAGSIPRSGSSRQSRRGKAQTTKGNAHMISAKEIHQVNSNILGSYLNDTQTKKSLYTNISLREISQSPESKITNGQAGRIVMIASKTKPGGTQRKNMNNGKMMLQNQGSAIGMKGEQQNLSFTQYQPLNTNQLTSNGNTGSVQNMDQINFENQMQLKNYLSHLNQTSNSSQQSQGKQETDKNGNSVLNIKTVQDINIYNNSFIVSSANLVPQQMQQLASQPGQIRSQSNQLVQPPGPVQIQNQANSQVTTVSTAKKGLKLRKELSGLTSGLSQARSASQGRQGNRVASTSSNPQLPGSLIANGPTRNHQSGLTEYNSYGAIQTASQMSKLSKAYDIYNQNLRTQNIKSLQQNPNQMRVLNPPNKMFGNLAAISGIHKGTHQNKVQTFNAQYVVQAQAPPLNKVIKGMSQNTSRGASRADSRQGNRQMNAKTTDQKFLQQNLGNMNLTDLNLKNQQTSNASLNLMKINYITNQKIMISQQNLKNGESNRPVSQIESIIPSNLFNETEYIKANMNVNDQFGGNNYHSQSQVLNSSVFQSQQYQQAGKPGKLKNINSYELRKHSLQDIKMKGVSSETVHKFKNQVQNISSDQDREQISMVGTDPGMTNSMSQKNQQFFRNSKLVNRNKTQEAKGIKESNSPDIVNNKLLVEFQQKLQGFHLALQKIQKSCHEIKPGNKEEQIKSFQKQLDPLMVKVNIERKKLSQQPQGQATEEIKILYFNLSQQMVLLKAIFFIDIGQNFECINELKKINQISQITRGLSQKKNESLTSDQLLAANLVPEQVQLDANIVKDGLLIMSLAQHRMGEHQESIDTVTHCINEYSEFKDAYLVRGSKFLLQKKHQKALQDFIKFDQMVASEIQLANQKVGSTPGLVQYLGIQVCIGKESMGDAYKKMKKYKQAAKCYQDALNELQLLMKTKSMQADLYKTMANKLQNFQIKIKTKIAMCSYYLGSMKKSLHIFEDLINYYKKFDPSQIKTQQKSIKSNYYYGKAMMTLKDKDTTNSVDHMQALSKFSFCINEEIDPELHELYSGNAMFEVFKFFIKQKDIFSAHDYLQKATDNNFNSKRLSLYRDFTEGVVYLMKRKIKKGVQILSDLLEVLINGQKEIEKRSKKNDENAGQELKKDRYNLIESEQNLEGIALKGEVELIETVAEDKTTLNSKANQIGSGQFSQEMYDFLILNIYLYRCYGYVAIEKYEHALDDLRKAKRINPKYIDTATIYNKWLSRGILKMDTEDYLMASKYFGKASLHFPQNKDAFCLNAISIVRSYSFSFNNQFIDNDGKLGKILQTREFLNIAIEQCCKDQKQPSLYFFRGLLNYQMHNFYDALNDFNVAIAEEEEPTGQFHLARGRCYACLSILDEAMKDLSIALELDDTLNEAYIFRGKCAYLLGDNNLAFHDFQKLIISDQKNPIVHIYAGNLLMTTGAYSDAIKAFDNADTVRQTPLASFQRIRCYCALSNLEAAFEQMQMAMHQAPNEKYMVYDYKVLLQLLSCVRSFAFSKGDTGEPDESGLKEQNNIIKNCISQLSSIIQQFENLEPMSLKKEGSPMTIQIIPNVNRIKLEKKLVISKLQPHQEGIPHYTPLTELERKSVEIIKRYGYYTENIFNLEEMYLYRAIFNIYTNNYSAALTDLNKSWKQHFTQKNKDRNLGNNNLETDKEQMFGKFPVSQLMSPNESLRSYSNSQKTDLSEVGLCSLNVGEYSLNQMIICIQINNWPDALKKVNEVMTSNPTSNENVKNMKRLLLVRALIHQEMGSADKHNQDITLYLKNFSQITKNAQNAVLIEPFESKGRICSLFEPITLNFKKNKSKSSFEVQMRPSFSMPFIKPPNMIPNVNEDVVQNEFNLKQIDAPMPESPWINHCLEKDTFQPEHYFYQLSPRWDQKVYEKMPKLPDIVENQVFVNQYFNRDKVLMYDEKVMEDIDDISDTEKVSLISDIEMNDDTIPVQTKTDQDPGPALNLLQLQNQINDKDQSKSAVKGVSRVSNGISLTKSKQRCLHKQKCSSCYYLPGDSALVQISNQDQLIEHFKMSPGERHRKNQYLRSQQKDQGEYIEDTISEEEYGTSEDDSISKKKDSKCTHSRFSSQIADDLEDMNVQIGEFEAHQKDIESQHIEIGEKQLTADNRNLLNKKAQKVGVQGLSKAFMEDIDSIQKREENFDEYTPEIDSSSLNRLKQVQTNNFVPDDDEMVMMASKNLSKVQKKKVTGGKKLGIGNLGIANLKKNKLAIAFNNLEVDQKRGSNSKDSDN